MNASTPASTRASTPASTRGMPSAVWRAGQHRRLDMIASHLPASPAPALDLGCGLGMYTARLAELNADPVGVEVEWSRALDAREAGLPVTVAVGEALPFPDATFGTVLLHEVLEHVADDRRTASEAVRVLRPGGRIVVFAPNRGWPFETHGVYWRGAYRFGNFPAVNYLPDAWRNALVPHARVYTAQSLLALFDGLPVEIVAMRGVFPGYDNLAARQPRLGTAVRSVTYRLEHTPLHRLGLSHFLVVERIS